MRVLFDMLPLSFSHQSGVFIYSLRILKGWVRLGIKDVVVLTTPWLAENIIKEIAPEYDFLLIDIPKINKRSIRCLKTAYLRRRIINKSGCDVVFYPMPEPYFFQKLSIPTVAVMHDTSFATSPWYFSKLLIPYQFRKHNRIISITQYTKEEALKIYPFLSEQKIHVVHNCMDPLYGDFETIVEKKYVLCVNTLYKYKNADTLIKAFSLIANRIEEDLILVGADVCNRKNELQNLASELGLCNRFHIYSDLSEQSLVSLYQHASLFVSPSKMEGFGQTPIEAAIYKCPVITSTETALPESTMNQVFYYSPVDSYENLANIMLSVLQTPPSQEELSRISHVFLNEYDYRHQSKKVYEYIYENICK